MGNAQTMSPMNLREMTTAEFFEFRVNMIDEYATEQVQAALIVATWAREVATQHIDELLPEGRYTAGMRFLTAEAAHHLVVGHAWFGLRDLEHSSRSAWLYGIDVIPAQRNKGYGRELLAAVENLAASEGATTLGLNVFAGNTVARRLYEAAGYELATQQLQKKLPRPRGIGG